MNHNFRKSRRSLSTRRIALLTTAIAGFGTAALVFSQAMQPHSAFDTAAQAQNLSEKVQQLPQRPVGFADIVEKVKPAVISVRVKIDRPASPDASDDDLKRLADIMAADHVDIEVELGTGTAEATVYGCDLTADYVRINSDYTT